MTVLFSAIFSLIQMVDGLLQPVVSRHLVVESGHIEKLHAGKTFLLEALLKGGSRIPAVEVFLGRYQGIAAVFPGKIDDLIGRDKIESARLSVLASEGDTVLAPVIFKGVFGDKAPNLDSYEEVRTAMIARQRCVALALERVNGNKEGANEDLAKRALHACGKVVRKTCVTRFESPSSRCTVFVC